jgi:hypothetical protein
LETISVPEKQFHAKAQSEDAKNAKKTSLCLCGLALCLFVNLFQDRGLGTESELMPALKGIDRFTWHDANERGLEVE